MKRSKTIVYLHAVNDSKVVYRISTKHAASPQATLKITVRDKSTGKKERKEVKTSAAHWTFRKKMGFNDQSDAKRSLIGLSGRYYKS